MSIPEPSIRINVDVTNPGQFFACCGLLELADRQWQGAEGWFTDGRFCLVSATELPTLLATLIMDPPEEVTQLANGLEVKPLIAPLRFSFDGGSTISLVLDAWMTMRVEKGEIVTVANPPWNFWSGQQTSFRIWNALRNEVAGQLKTLDSQQLEDLFFQRVPLYGRFGFDPAPAWTALDVGFSPNEQKIEVASSAFVELLAAVGVQRFRPCLSSERDAFVYGTWGQPLAPTAAAAAVAGILHVPPAGRFRCRVIRRGSYAALSYSTPLPLRGELYEYPS